MGPCMLGGGGATSCPEGLPPRHLDAIVGRGRARIDHLLWCHDPDKDNFPLPMGARLVVVPTFMWRSMLPSTWRERIGVGLEDSHGVVVPAGGIGEWVVTCARGFAQEKGGEWDGDRNIIRSKYSSNAVVMVTVMSLRASPCVAIPHVETDGGLACDCGFALCLQECILWNE